MASTSKARQNKLVKLAMAPETTVGTYVPLTTSTFVLPITSFSPPSPDRGTRLISRNATMDGFGGGMLGVIGSFGWTISAEAEIHAPGIDGNLPYWLPMLLASGHECNPGGTEGDFTVLDITPTLSNQEIANFSSADNEHPPCTVSLSWIRNNDQVEDTVIRMRGCTGATTFNLVTNEMAKISTTFVGLLQNNELLDSSDVNVSALGDYPTTKPYVVKSITLQLLDDTATPVSAYGLRNLTFSTGFETPENIDPTETWGYSISPPILNADPTLSFAISNTSTVDQYLADAMLAGALFSINVTLVSETDDNRLRFIFPTCQYTGISEVDNGGLADYQIEAVVVRTPGDDQLYTIQHLYKTS